MTSICPPPRRSLADIASTLESASEALAGSPSQALAGTGRLAAHLTAVDRSLYDAAVKRAPGRDETVTSALASSHRVMESLRLLERRLAGDQLMAATSIAELTDRAQREVAAYRIIESQLCAQLAESLSPDELDVVVRQYHEAMSHAPSRPHPHTPGHHGHPWSWALRVERLVDSVRDALDARPAPVVKPRRPLPPQGRWTSYLLGGAASNEERRPSEPDD